LTDDQNRLVGCEESDEDEGIEEEQSDNDDLAVTILGSQPSVQEDTRNDTDVTRVAI